MNIPNRQLPRQVFLKNQLKPTQGQKENLYLQDEAITNNSILGLLKKINDNSSLEGH